ncbi:uncharacterized protein NECHADRAFT_75641 [Fusarium vanettenii 77-13-4]|uniref:Uncharacterized protein n=1 Tax=Fusarium vanettenii (strain ATCC MYA-4622 / CBS 123669 / FGSC 9596 / NRRL 45880 / 77-13-4) TaxID=660122 RepID=C7YJD6_FUSV7|nr:uncharacterized protein NECHADRAFT_75641 [Fusarium vanettenii 77-13-4]EEU48960.1 predicted protein [Fusarium vanettenii 77-13-4]
MDYHKRIAEDAIQRFTYLTSFFPPAPLFLAYLLPRPAHAAYTEPFTPAHTLSPEQLESVDQAGGSLDFDNWVDRGMTIRKGSNVYECLANLTAALDLVGSLSQGEYNGAAGALSLLPTAGALLGAPTREMWIVYKLVPLAGLLSMFLSLGGTITPSNVGEYDPAEPFSYGGFMPTTRVRAAKRRPTTPASSAPGNRGAANTFEAESEQTQAQAFAQEVLQRAEDDSGGGIKFGIFLAMALQFVLIVSLLIPMWYAQRGAVVSWWCRVWGWMYFWYFLVTGVSIFDNLVAAPFTRSWTIRVSRKPTGILLDDTVSRITDRRKYDNALEAIKAGPNTNQRIRIATDKGSGYSRTCFYVVVSVQGISRMHAIAQIISKASSVAVYAFGTALFASASLMSISIALMVLCLLLPAGVAGRVIAMWIVSQIGRENKPILHKLVKSENEAGEYIHAIAELDLQLEIHGHVIMSGWCIRSRNRLFSPATYIGLLAKPFDAIALAEKAMRGTPHAKGSPVMQPNGFMMQEMSSPARTDEMPLYRDQRLSGE